MPERLAGGLNEITWVTCSAQRLVRGKRSIEKWVSAVADDDDENVKQESPEREPTLRVSSCSFSFSWQVLHSEGTQSKQPQVPLQRPEPQPEASQPDALHGDPLPQ